MSLDAIYAFVLILKFLVLFLIFLYVVFAFLITRQIRLLNSSFNTPYEKIFTFFGSIHFLISVIFFAFSILLL
ncbi:hypothetical protein A3K42_00640 [candidate division WWE3 bacterium RBG_13_37_7]|uniref:Uncharacterized protein n=1 Tax=candidate division WWE3 bacterium RBG_13_37_7 TaxID=1802609 RepID=A0A1F4U293_UNCKA|nr:MAG: hypothetical protein A3K42_00640 [candidate division WWE3 bacterium RBG_13_37_7]